MQLSSELILFSYIILQAVLYFLVEPWYVARIAREGKSIALHDERHTGMTNRFSALIEYGVLSRYSFLGYKNSARVNVRVFASMLLTLFIATTVYAVAKALHSGTLQNSPSLFKDLLFGISGFFLASFVMERKSLYEKWQYLAGFYNKIIEKPLKDESREIMLTELALDLLEMEMWAHRSFKDVFRTQIQHALAKRAKKKGSRKPRSTSRKLRLRKPQKKEKVRALLREYQESLVVDAENKANAEAQKQGPSLAA